MGSTKAKHFVNHRLTKLFSGRAVECRVFQSHWGPAWVLMLMRTIPEAEVVAKLVDTVLYNKSGKTSSIFQTWRSAPREVAEPAPRSRAVSRYRINIQWLCSEPVELEKPLSKSNSCLPNTKLKVARICLYLANFILLRESIRYENTVLKNT